LYFGQQEARMVAALEFPFVAVRMDYVANIQSPARAVER
jgi:hypothetical protein